MLVVWVILRSKKIFPLTNVLVACHVCVLSVKNVHTYGNRTVYLVQEIEMLYLVRVCSNPLCINCTFKLESLLMVEGYPIIVVVSSVIRRSINRECRTTCCTCNVMTSISKTCLSNSIDRSKLCAFFRKSVN